MKSDRLSSYEERQKQKREEYRKEVLPPRLDLRPICRHSDRCVTTIQIEADWDTKDTWIELGMVNITRKGDRLPGTWLLEAYLAKGVTDLSHDSAKAIRLPLIGLELDGLGVSYQSTWLRGWVDPNDSDSFRVPPDSNYNPTKLDGAYRCKEAHCLTDRPKGHMVVPEGYHLPPKNLTLYEKVRGKRVTIITGPVFKDDD